MILGDRAMRTWLKKYIRFTDYIGAASLYLKDNFLLEEPLQPKHIKDRILGHWGTVPGLNLLYAHCNYLLHKHPCEMLFITGPGHGAPAILANLYAEGALAAFYPKRFPVSKKGLGNIIKDFSWPNSGFPSHVTPGVPGSILEGGELGYSLSTAFGAVLDNPKLIAAVAIGDGEAESGPLAAAWNSTKFLNPKTDGAVLPLVHINGFKISNPTIMGSMSDTELKHYFKGLGYKPYIVGGSRLHQKMANAMEKAYQDIRKIQSQARSGKKVLKAAWPVIALRSDKGRGGIKSYRGDQIEGSFHSHGIPLGDPKTNPETLVAVEKWLRSYKVHELVDAKGCPKKEVLKFLPTKKYRMGLSKHATGGSLVKKLAFPSLKKLAVPVTNKNRGCTRASNMKVGATLMREIIKKNKRNFRLMCPDEVESNKLGAVFDVTNRVYTWPIPKAAEHVAYEGRVMEILSEHTIQGWMQGYLLTGRHAMFVSYEAFMIIIGSMVDQYAKFLKQSFKIKWRKPVPAAVYLLSSVGWRQDHNGYSHQNPSFVSNVLQKHGKFTQVFYPADANAFLVALEESLNRKDTINVIVCGKRDLPQWQTIAEAKEQAKTGMAVWEWVSGKAASKNPDVVLASAGDYITHESMMAVRLCQEEIPELKIRYVNVSEVSGLCLGDYDTNHYKKSMTAKEFNKYFTADAPVVFNYHGYVNDIEQILWGRADADRFCIHGYSEEGSTTTPFDMLVSNKVSRYHIAIDMVKVAAKRNKKIAGKCKKVVAMLCKRLKDHRAYINKHGDDPDHVKEACWIPRD